MIRYVMAAALAMAAAPALASDKKASCGYQAEVVAAVQQARLDRVKERDVVAHVTPDATWPESYNAAVPLIAGWVYSSEIKMRDVRNEDLAAAWTELCLAQ